MVKLAKRILNASPKSYGMFDKASKAEAAGAELIHLEFGRPIYDTPTHVKEATIQALEDGLVHYSQMQGDGDLRAALMSKLSSFNGLNYGMNEIVVTNGLTQATFTAIMSFISEGDEVILLDPYYPQHSGKIELAGGKVVTVPLDSENNFSIRAEWIEAAITPQTKMIILVNPTNPTGRVYSTAELQNLANIAIKNDLVVLSDEVYEYFAYDQHKHTSIATLTGMRERTISCFAFTKAFAMDGWRIGYLAADQRFISALTNVNANAVTHVNTFIQRGALAAVCGDFGPVQAMIDSDQRKRDLVVKRLNEMLGITCETPEGAIYAFPNISATGFSSDDFAMHLLENAGVVVESGSFYGPAGEGHIRVCFGSQTYERLQEAMDKISAAITLIPASAGAN